MVNRLHGSTQKRKAFHKTHQRHSLGTRGGQVQLIGCLQQGGRATFLALLLPRDRGVVYHWRLGAFRALVGGGTILLLLGTKLVVGKKVAAGEKT